MAAKKEKEPEFVTVLPEPYVPPKDIGEAAARVIAYIDSFGVRSHELTYIRDILLEGNAAE